MARRVRPKMECKGKEYKTMAKLVAGSRSLMRFEAVRRYDHSIQIQSYMSREQEFKGSIMCFS